MAGRVTTWVVFVLGTLQAAAGQTAPRTFLDKLLQSFAAPATYRPETSAERLHAYLLSMTGPVTIVTEAGAAGLSQVLDSPREWGQESGGYSKRFANDVAYNGVRSSLAFASSLLLKEDDRYFASTEERAWPRVKHALVSVFTAHKQDGRTVFATSSVVGIVGASLISRAWAPPSWQTPRGVMRSVGFSIVGAGAFNVVREFLPGVLRRRR